MPGRAVGPATILQGGRPKAYRPIPEAQRRAAIEDGLAAYARGDAFEAHELLEPAWMGSADLAERELLQGLIKLSAAFVHAARRNPAGFWKNLRGALGRLEQGRDAAPSLGIDGNRLVATVTRRLEHPDVPGSEVEAIEIPRLELPRGG